MSAKSTSTIAGTMRTLFDIGDVLPIQRGGGTGSRWDGGAAPMRPEAGGDPSQHQHESDFHERPGQAAPLKRRGNRSLWWPPGRSLDQNSLTAQDAPIKDRRYRRGESEQQQLVLQPRDKEYTEEDSNQEN